MYTEALAYNINKKLNNSKYHQRREMQVMLFSNFDLLLPWPVLDPS